MTNRTELKEYMRRPLAERLSQTKLAEAVGVTQGAVWQMINNPARQVFVLEHDDGRVELEETRLIRGNGAAA